MGCHLSGFGVPSVWALLEEGQGSIAPRGLRQRAPTSPGGVPVPCFLEKWVVCVPDVGMAQALLRRLLQSLA